MLVGRTHYSGFDECCKYLLDIAKGYNFEATPVYRDLSEEMFTATFNSMEATGIIIENVEQDFLHLRGVKIFSKGKEIDGDSLPKYQCHAKSEWKDIPLAEKYRIGDIKKDYAFHTKKGKNTDCRFSIAFDEPVRIDKIQIILRRHKAWRSKSCRITVLDKLGNENVVFDNPKRIIESLSKHSKKAFRNTDYTEEQCKYLMYLFFSILHDPEKYSRPSWMTILQQAESHGLDQDSIKRFLNESVLLEKRLQFCSFGLVKTFRCWTDGELHDFLLTTREAIDAIKPFCPDTFYTFGTLLGFIREQRGFIPHDVDIDIMCLFNERDYKSLSDVKEEFFPYLESNGFKIVEAWNTAYHVTYKGSNRFDIFPALIHENGEVTSYPARIGRYLTVDYLVPTIDIEVSGISCPIPKNPFRFLETVYGKDWRVPVDRKTFN